jgi:hypothetical protein
LSAYSQLAVDATELQDYASREVVAQIEFSANAQSERQLNLKFSPAILDGFSAIGSGKRSKP